MARIPLLVQFESLAVVVVGAGPVGRKRAKMLVEAGANVQIIDPSPPKSAFKLGCEVVSRRFESADLDGANLVVAASDDPATQQEVASIAALRAVLCSREDSDRGAARFMIAGEKDDVTIAVDSGEMGPTAASWLVERALATIPAWWRSAKEHAPNLRSLPRTEVLRWLNERDN